jgi:hypothetical protein
MLLAYVWGTTQDFALSVRVRRVSNELFVGIIKDTTGDYLNRTAVRWALDVPPLLQGHPQTHVDNKIVDNLKRNQVLGLHEGMLNRGCVPEYLEFLDKMIGTAHGLGLPKTTRAFIDGYMRMVVFLDKTPRTNDVETDMTAVEIVRQSLNVRPELLDDYSNSLVAVKTNLRRIDSISGLLLRYISVLQTEKAMKDYFSSSKKSLDQ